MSCFCFQQWSPVLFTADFVDGLFTAPGDCVNGEHWAMQQDDLNLESRVVLDACPQLSILSINISYGELVDIKSVHLIAWISDRHVLARSGTVWGFGIKFCLGLQLQGGWALQAYQVATLAVGKNPALCGTWQALRHRHTHGAAGSPLLLAVLSASARRQAEGNGAEVTLHLRRGASRQARATLSSVGTA